MVVKADVSKDTGAGEEERHDGAQPEAQDIYLLKKDLLDACRRMIAESLRDRRER